MKTALGIKKKVSISETVGTKIATRLFRGLALGALLVAATGLYFSINQGEAGSPHKPSASGLLSNREMERLDYEADMLLFAEAHKPSASRPLSNREIERLDYEVDIMLIGASAASSVGKHLSNREIERLDYEMDMMLIEAARDTVTTRPFSSEQTQDLPAFLQTEVWLPGDTYPSYGR